MAYINAYERPNGENKTQRERGGEMARQRALFMFGMILIVFLLVEAFHIVPTIGKDDKENHGGKGGYGEGSSGGHGGGGYGDHDKDHHDGGGYGDHDKDPHYGGGYGDHDKDHHNGGGYGSGNGGHENEGNHGGKGGDGGHGDQGDGHH